MRSFHRFRNFSVFCAQVFLLHALFLAAVPFLSAAAEGDAAVTGLTVGFRGCYKNGCQTPADVWFRPGDAGDSISGELTAVLESEDPDGTPVCWKESFTVTGSEPVHLRFLFSSGRENAPLTVCIFSASGEEIVRRKFSPDGEPERSLENEQEKLSEVPESERVIFPKPVGSERPIWLVVGGDASGLEGMLGGLQLSSERIPILVSLAGASELPSQVGGYDAADLVVLSASGSDQYTDSAERLSLLKEWVYRGGKTVLFGNPNSIPALVPGGILADFVPGTVREGNPGELRAAPNLVRFVPKAKNLVMLGTLDSPFLKFPVVEETASDVLVELEENGVPFLLHRPAGFGVFIFFAADPQIAPLADWNGRNGLLMKIFASEVERLTAGSTGSGLIRLGYRDLPGQIRSALDRFDGVRVFPFSAVLALMFLFVLAVGPLDWVLTHRLFKRPNLTWVTLPVWVLLFGGTAVWIGASRHPSEPRINAASLTDYDAETGRLRSSIWGGIYAPADTSLRISVKVPGSGNSESSLSWFGLTGTGLGGMSSPIQSIQFQHSPYLLNGGEIPQFPVPVRSTRSVSGTWFSLGEPSADLRLTDREGVLTGKIVNPWGRPIDNAVLLYGNHLWVLGKLDPGEISITAKTARTDEVGRVLIGAVNPFDGRMGEFESADWKKYSDTSAELDPIFRMTGFYRIAGGEPVSGLGNEGVLRLDASESVNVGRAVLYGTVQADEKENTFFPLGRLDVQTDSGTLFSETAAVRIYIPVTKE